MRYMARPSIYTLSAEMIGFTPGSSPGNAVWPAANDAIFVPLNISRPILVKRLFCANANVAGNNIDMGIYSQDGELLRSIGSTAQSGTSVLQFFDITDIYLSPGQYYLAIAMNGTTGTLRRQNVSVIREQQAGMLKAASNFPLATLPTFATMTATYVPIIGLDLGGTL